MGGGVAFCTRQQWQAVCRANKACCGRLPAGICQSGYPALIFAAGKPPAAVNSAYGAERNAGVAGALAGFGGPVWGRGIVIGSLVV